MSQDIHGVFPGSDDYSHEIVLRRGGRAFGLTLQNGIQSIQVVPPARQQPVVNLQQNSWENGRGVEVWKPNQNSYFDSQNLWSTTPNKLHPTLLQRWATGMRDAEMNMPYAGAVHSWKPLYTGSGNTRYLDVAFTASASSNRERCFLILRRKTSAQNTTMPGTLTVEWCIDSAGKPSTVQKTVTKVAADAPDVTSYYIEFKPAAVLAVTSGTVYHIKIYGDSVDTASNCWEVLCDTTAAGFSSTDNTNWANTAFSPYYRITDEDKGQNVYTFMFNSALYAVTSNWDGVTASKIYINGCRGYATAGTTVLLTDTGAGQYGGTWTTNMWAGYKIRITTGTGQGQVRDIASNTATTITPTKAWNQAPGVGSGFYIYGGPKWVEITGHGLGVVVTKPVVSNGTCYFPQGDTVDIREMQLDSTKANDHDFTSEATNHNRAFFLASGYVQSAGPSMWRANEDATTGAVISSNAKAISVSRASMAPSGTPIGFGTNMVFAPPTGTNPILTGDNTYRINGIYVFQNNLHVMKEDTLYVITNDVPSEIKYGASGSPSLYNGRAACVGMDGQFYIAVNHDVMLLSGSASYPTGLPNNLPSTRVGYVLDMFSVLGWLFAAVQSPGGDSSVMKLSLDTKAWSEQLRGWVTGRGIRGLIWQSNPEFRPFLWIDCQGELIYQEFPTAGTGIRPIDDPASQYQHEGVITFPTIDLLTTDPKYFSFLTVDSKGLASTSTTSAAYGRDIIFEYQLDDQVNTSSWTSGGSFGISPTDKIILGKGSRHKIRIRLRINSNKAADPPIIENMGLSLFTKHITYGSFLVTVNNVSDDDFKAEDLYNFLLEMTVTADVMDTECILSVLHKQRVILEVQPNAAFTNLDEDTGADDVLQIYLEILPT